MEHNTSEESRMEAQLVSLYAEREMLQEALGTADASEIIAMVQSLEAQCNDLYSEKDQEKEDAR